MSIEAITAISNSHKSDSLRIQALLLQDIFICTKYVWPIPVFLLLPKLWYHVVEYVIGEIWSILCWMQCFKLIIALQNACLI